ncbi:MAG: extracellular solute-binding protein, partial [Alphaproteobacteria bacterium]|nr:extracellular solute-binding protein [Alphaproteobacteria bacterium]
MKTLITYTLLVFFLIISAPALADGLAMHGTPKYGADASHLDYVNPDAPKGGTLRQAGIGTFDTLNPFSIKGKAAEGLNLTYDRLMARVWDEPFTLYPLIAERVEVPEDRSSFTVHINPKARFHDNTPITADDVLFSYETLKTSGRPNMRRIYALATSVTKDGPLTVTFKFGPGYDRETVMIFAIMPVLSKSYWSARTFDSTTLDIPVTNGPYKIASIDPGRKITYERVKDYWAADLLPNKGQFNFDTITYDYFRDDMIALEAFKAGNLDIRREYDAGRWASSYDFPAVRAGDVRLDSIGHNRAERVRSFIFNARRPPFDDRRVRMALTQVLDFDWINHTLFHGQYNQIRSYFPNTELAAKDPMTTAVRAAL